MGPLDVIVVGAGVIGLTAAVSVAESGRSVEVWTADFSLQTTSAAAGAAWGLHLLSPVGRAWRWSEETLAVLLRLCDTPGTGVRLAAGIEASREADAERPEWVQMISDIRTCRPDELPEGYRSGYHYTVPLVDMPVYLEHLVRRLEAAGGAVRLRPVESLDEPAAAAPVVVNCAGLQAARLAGDPEMQPVRGQLVVTTNPGISEWFGEDTGDSEELLYIYPHADKVVLGGTAELGQESLVPDPVVARRILDRCAAVMPSLTTARVLEHRVGLRPHRPKIRLEEEPRSGGRRVIHDYGHGGAGVTLAWGCAAEVVRMLG